MSRTQAWLKMPYEIQALLGQLGHERHLNRVTTVAMLMFLFENTNNIIMKAATQDWF